VAARPAKGCKQLCKRVRVVLEAPVSANQQPTGYSPAKPAFSRGVYQGNALMCGILCRVRLHRGCASGCPAVSERPRFQTTWVPFRAALKIMVNPRIRGMGVIKDPEIASGIRIWVLALVWFLGH